MKQAYKDILKKSIPVLLIIGITIILSIAAYGKY